MGHASTRKLGIALAACAFALPAIADGETVQLQLTPAGEFMPSDGRRMDVPAWRMDAATAARVIARYQARQTPAVVDYEHQTLNKEANGQPAPAAGWIRDLVWKEGQGLFGTVELTARARELIGAGEYRYVSPVFRFDPATGDVLAIEMAALTNTPAIHGMEPLSLRAAATFGIHAEEDSSMNKLLAAVVAALSLSADATEDQAIAACSALKPKLGELASLRKSLGIADNVSGEAAVAACTAIKAKADAGSPDPSKYVSVEAFEQVKGQLAALTANQRDREIDELVTRGLEEGRLLKAQESWARELGKKDIAALSAYLQATQPIAALTSTQTGGKAPAQVDEATGLTADELAVCSATGIAPEAFAKAKGNGKTKAA